jgi:hypothetical protein
VDDGANNLGAFLRAALADLSDEAGTCLRSSPDKACEVGAGAMVSPWTQRFALDLARFSGQESFVMDVAARCTAVRQLFGLSCHKAGQFMRLAQPVRTFPSLALPTRRPRRSRRYLYPAPPPISQNLGAQLFRIELDGRLVPVQDTPFHSTAISFPSNSKELLE